MTLLSVGCKSRLGGFGSQRPDVGRTADPASGRRLGRLGQPRVRVQRARAGRAVQFAECVCRRAWPAVGGDDQSPVGRDHGALGPSGRTGFVADCTNSGEHARRWRQERTMRITNFLTRLPVALGVWLVAAWRWRQASQPNTRRQARYCWTQGLGQWISGWSVLKLLPGSLRCDRVICGRRQALTAGADPPGDGGAKRLSGSTPPPAASDRAEETQGGKNHVRVYSDDYFSGPRRNSCRRTFGTARRLYGSPRRPTRVSTT